MSTNYTDTLKRIKEAEEASNREVSDKKKALEAELHEIERVADESIEVAKRDAELYTTKQVEAARESAEREANELLATTTRKAEQMAAKRLTKKELRRIMDEIIFSEFSQKKGSE
jgi:vacuolar-type H+-ATPase subunit H